MDMSSGSSSASPGGGWLSASGVDFSNKTQAAAFLHDLKHQMFLPIQGAAYARYFWYGIIVVVVVTAIFNRLWELILRNRIRANAAKQIHPAKPKILFMKALSTVTAIIREASYLQFTPARRSSCVMFPSVGSIYIILAYFGFIVGLTFTNNNIPEAGHWQSLGVRAGWIGAAQVPLLVLLAGKFNIIGFICNSSYERLNIYHRWVARGLLLLSTFHFAFQNHGWDIFHISDLEWTTDTCPIYGISAYAFILWMNLTTFAPIRYFSYRFFVIQHMLTYFGFIIALSFHLDTSPGPQSQNYVYATVAIFLITNIARIVRYIYYNIRPGRASLESLEGDATRIRISSRLIKTWTPGRHVLVAIPGIELYFSIPATIISTPTSHNGDIVLLMKPHKRFTKRLFSAAGSSPPSSEFSTDYSNSPPVKSYVTLIDGPYGGSHSDFACFDTLILIAGSTGVTFALSNLLAIAHLAATEKIPLRIVRFIWVVKKHNWISWVSEELKTSFNLLHDAGIEVCIEVYATCDDSLADPADSNGCQCDDNCNCCKPSQSENTHYLPSSEKSAIPENISTLNGAPKAHVTSCPDLRKGRPAFGEIMREAVVHAGGEVAVAACGPLGLLVSVRSAVVITSDDLAVHKGTGYQGIYLHVESFK
ncbi:hypothetical protein UA08_01378 [Talaromyces atroroseus]|uniref:FAD-binding FR-type domain-containing protein n=1 Tax=Talaromyces atroroseus TaxID=1441469 RepID=A0A1Q5QB65_TALAT|nr:hypothetical protein UA08_01378 [Talaromyces atroroseus]OKL63183.1 hypothetical protein UA08_01378 [Talaromyces atroroseus]